MALMMNVLDNTCGSGSDLAECMDVRHDIVSPPLFLCSGYLKLLRVEMLRESVK